MDINKKLLKTQYRSNKNTMQIPVEGEMIISDTRPDIKEIISERAEPSVTAGNVTDGRVSFKGVLSSGIIYISKDEENPVSGASTIFNFEDFMNFEGILKDDCVKISAFTEHCEFRRVNERKVAIRAVVTIVIQKYSMSTAESIIPPEDKNGLQCLTESKIVRNHVLQNKTVFDIHETLSVPAAKPAADEVIFETYRVSDVDTKAMHGGYRITGVLNAEILYITSEGGLDSAKFDVPFDYTVDNDNVTEDMKAYSDIVVTEFKTGVFQDSSGENRIVDIDAVFSAVTDIFEDEKATYVSDAYYLQYPCVLEKNNITLPVFIGHNKARVAVKGTGSQTAGTDILQVINVSGNVTSQSAYAGNGYAAAEGVAEVTVLYVAEDDAKPVYSLKAYVPFHQEIEMAGAVEGDNIACDISLDGITFNIMNSREVEITANIIIEADIVRLEEKSAVSGIKDDSSSESCSPPAAVIYVVQKEDTLWDIAKRYCAVKEDIMSLNNIESEDLINQGEKILIMRKV